MFRYFFTTLLVPGTILSISRPAIAMDESQLKACSQVQLPSEIDLMQPIPSRWTDCLPTLNPVAKISNGVAGRMKAALNRLPNIGNEGGNEVVQVIYNISLQQFKVKGQVRARQVTDIRVPDIRRERRCISKPWPLKGAWCENVPVKIGTKVERITTYSATCSYTYTQNVGNGRMGGSLGCGEGAIGVKIRFDSIAALLQGQLPSLSELISTVDFRTPIIKDASRDTYEAEVSKIMADNPDARIYFSSQPFVQWASAEELGLSLLLQVVSVGTATPILVEKIEGQLRTEGINFISWAATNAVQMNQEQFIDLFSNSSNVDIPNFRPRIKFMNIPIAWNKCLSSGPCTGEIKKPRLGFAIIFDKL